MTRVYMLWNGGSGYAPAALDDLEQFDTIAEAMWSFSARTHDSYYPCCYDDTPEDGGPTAHVFFKTPPDPRDPYPDEVWSFGPRGGTRRESA